MRWEVYPGRLLCGVLHPPCGIPVLPLLLLLASLSLLLLASLFLLLLASFSSSVRSLYSSSVRSLYSSSL